MIEKENRILDKRDKTVGSVILFYNAEPFDITVKTIEKEKKNN